MANVKKHDVCVTLGLRVSLHKNQPLVIISPKFVNLIDVCECFWSDLTWADGWVWISSSSLTIPSGIVRKKLNGIFHRLGSLLCVRACVLILSFGILINGASVSPASPQNRPFSDLLRNARGTFHFRPCDVTNDAEVASAIEQVASKGSF